MSTNQVDAPARHAPTRSGARGFADRWPFRRKLNLLVGIPLAVITCLLSYLFTDLVQQSGSAASAAQLVRDSAQVARLVDRVEAEHQQAILLSARYESGDTKPSKSAYRAAQKAVDSQVEKVRESFGEQLPEREAQALHEVGGLTSLRTSVERSYLPADNIDPAYTNASQGLIDGLSLDRNTDLAATFTGNLLDSLLRADAAHGAFETNVFAATTGDTNAQIEFTSAVGAYDLYIHQADRFARFATEEQTDRLGGIEHTPAQREIAQAFAELQVDAGQLQAQGQRQIRLAVQGSLAGYPAYPQQAAARLKITTSLIGEIADRADGAATSARWRAGLLLSGALIAFVLWIAFAVLVRRSVIRPVQALTGAAQEVAEVAGRELARVADDDAEDDGPPRLRDMPVTARDEIGDLAEAFNRVQTTAAALLERQVLSRRNTAEMFGNVGRRVSNLTTRQLTLIDAVERGETDPALLERLYSIDHIAVRLRRNADSLMLLAGIRETVLEAGPAALSNVVRAALGQIEGYQRVRLYAAADAMVDPDVVGDLTLMTAELLENAVGFSPESSPVEVTVRSGTDGARVAITDHGLGMSAERLAEENARLVRRERLDLMPTKVLGLFVVGALARRWEIGVELTRTPGGGVTAEVSLPTSVLLMLNPQADTPVTVTPGPAAVVSGPVPARGVPRQASVDSAPGKAVIVGPAQAEAARTDVAGPLPRRIPRREQQSGPVPDGTTTTARGTGTAAARTGTVTSGSDSPAADRPAAAAGEQTAAVSEQAAARPSGTGRPLRRRVRGATLPSTAGAAPAVPQSARPLDAEAVRSALEEFEEAVERAQRDSDTEGGTRPEHTPAPHPDAAARSARADRASPEHGRPAPTIPPHDQNHLPEGAEQ
ncbi:ATP-binding protein [Streptomyces pluripotens]|uniref:histidine kinase n=1 Tax=Streptomyces pluripotens TaxID=1355015 RepID=A0A221P5Y7_9ACTN|nr:MULTISPECIES: ATP-binding protein [Streptomyces]ARP72956.1 ATP-binding protein [Streptomyces pluripotens]ASN27205.1 ATP-binding protein [Streptomyces pluripotens]MCH0557865.1 sensor histidine kinase [Streptomyces sp. MUM 16J]